jgi:hypothetical protein
MTVQNTSISLSSGRLAVFDTAASMILGPSDDVDAIWSAVLGESLNVSAHLYQYRESSFSPSNEKLPMNALPSSSSSSSFIYSNQLATRT